MSIIPHIIVEHAEEAGLLWALRDRGVRAPHFTLANLTQFDDRLAAHLDGLTIAGPAGTASLREELRWGQPGDVFAASVLAFEADDEERIRQMLDVAVSSRELSRGLVSALGWLPYDKAREHIERLLTSGSPALRRIAIGGIAAHRRAPAPAWSTALEDGDVLLRARALRAGGELGRLNLLPQLRAHLADDGPSCRAAGAWSVALLTTDNDYAVDVLRQVVEANREESPRALQVALRRMEVASAKDWIRRMDGNSRLARSAVVGAGVLGDPDLVPWLIERMKTPELARVAGEAFAMITGDDVARQNLGGSWPEGFTAGPSEDPNDERVEMDPDENLPWPDLGKIAAWWAGDRERFQPGTRYLLGRPLVEEWLEDVLRHGYQRQRAAAALELAIRRPGTPLFEVRAAGFRQKDWLGLK
jgi:uncharacterized protein (TIGR02270 family)